jgi:hypothetical protein
MTEGFHIQHPMAFFIPIMSLFVVIQLIASRERRRETEAQEWPKAASLLLLVALCIVVVFARLR